MENQKELNQTEQKQITKDDIIEKLRERYISLCDDAHWYRRQGVNHLFELLMVRRMAISKAMDIFENSKDVAEADDKLMDEAYRTHGFSSYVEEGLINLAEFLNVENEEYLNTHYFIKSNGYSDCVCCGKKTNN